MFNFFKKKEKKESKEKVGESYDLGDIVFHRMPKKFLKEAPAVGVKHSNKIGIIIVVIGVLVILAGGFFLARYIFVPADDARTPDTTIQSDTTNTGADNNPAPEPDASSDEGPVFDTVTDTELPDDSINPVGDEEIIECGTMTALIGRQALADLDSDAVLRCLGENIINNCHEANGIIKTSSFGDVELKVLEENNGDCIIQLNYPSSGQIIDDNLLVYANTSLQCAFGKDELSEFINKPGETANYVYTQSSVLNLTPESSCAGSAFNIWLDQAIIELPPEPEAPADFVLATDTDSDGLSDYEEESIFGTDSNSPDTDGDSYSDSSEALNLYNPAGSGTLRDSGMIGEYSSETNSYTIFYPNVLTKQEQTQSVLFIAGNKSFIQITVQENTLNQPIKAWYANLTNTPTAEILQTVQMTENGYEYIYSDNGVTAYVSSPGNLNVYTISYTPSATNKLELMTVLRMMINSLEIN
ncbi:MAG: hypothetical protein Q8Q23_01555 [bacterium]|nr:hypothetical protein [bacterium]